MSIIKCPKCGNDISDKAKRCVHCGSVFDEIKTIVCEECGNELKNNEKECPHCGFPVENNNIMIEGNDNSKQSSKIKCTYCGSSNIQVQIVSHNKSSGFFTILLYKLHLTK